MPQMRHPSKGKLCGTVQRPHPASCMHEDLRTALQGLANLLFPPLIFPRFGREAMDDHREKHPLGDKGTR